MKFTSVAVAALFLANTSAVLLRDDCKGKWCNKGLPYDLDVPTLNKAEADNVAKTQHFNGATKADAVATATAAASGADAAAKGAADAAAGAVKADAAAAFAGTSYKDKAAFGAAEAANAAAVKANQERVAYEKDQLERGENQDRLKFVNEATAAKTSEIQGKHDERERSNGKLLT